MEVREGRSEQRPGGGSTEPPGDCVELRGLGRCLRSPSQRPECQTKETRAWHGAGVGLGHGQNPGGLRETSLVEVEGGEDGLEPRSRQVMASSVTAHLSHEAAGGTKSGALP